MSRHFQIKGKVGYKKQVVYGIETFFLDGQFLKPEIVLHPKSQDRLKGENITLNCSAASTESQGKPTEFKWKKDGTVSFKLHNKIRKKNSMLKVTCREKSRFESIIGSCFITVLPEGDKSCKHLFKEVAQLYGL